MVLNLKMQSRNFCFSNYSFTSKTMYLLEPSHLFLGFLVSHIHVIDSLQNINFSCRAWAYRWATCSCSQQLLLDPTLSPAITTFLCLPLPSIGCDCQAKMCPNQMLSSFSPKAAENCWRGLGSPESDFIDTMVLGKRVTHWAIAEPLSCLPVAKRMWGAEHPAWDWEQ